jgi:hypothetical protein
MSLPKPPFRSVAEELLYEIYTRINGTMTGLKAEDINTLTKLNAILTDADLMKATDIINLVNAVKGSVPEVANTLEKVYGIVQGLNFLRAEDIDTLAELNAILGDADIVKNADVSTALDTIKGNVPESGNTLEKLYNIIQGLNYLSQDQIDTLTELNAIITDADLVRVEDLVNSINALKGNVPIAADTLEKLNTLIQTTSRSRSVQFQFKSNQFAEQALLFKGLINSLSQDFTNELSSVSYKSRLDTADIWTHHANLAALQTWINTNITGNEAVGTKFWIKCIATYKAGQTEEARNILYYLG